MFVEGVSVRGDGFEVQGSLAREEVFDLLAFALQSAGEDEQPLHLDDADGFLLDVVQFLGGVEDAVGVLLVRAVVAEDEVDLIFPVVVDAGGGGDGVVGGDGAVRVLGAADDVRVRVGVGLPGAAEFLSRLDEARAVFALQPDDGVVPLGDGDVDVGEVLHRIASSCAGLEDGQHLFAALVVVVREDGAAHDGERRVGADEVAGEEIHKVQHTAECRGVDVHRAVLLGDRNDVLLEVDVGGELHEPLLAVQLEGDGAEGLAGGMRRVARKADVLGAEHALGVARLRLFGASDLFGGLFGLGEVDGDDDLAAGVVILPPDVAVDVGAADVRRFFREVAEPFGGFHAAVLRRDVVKGLDDLGRRGGEHAHDAGLEELPVLFRAEFQAYGVGGERGERLVEVVLADGRVRRLRQTEHIQQGIRGINDVRFVHMQVVHGVVHEVGDIDLCELFKGLARRHKTSQHTHFPCKREDAVLS